MSTFTNDSSTLVPAVMKPLKAQDTASILASESSKAQLLDKLTEELYQRIVAECTTVQPRSKLPVGQSEES